MYTILRLVCWGLLSGRDAARYVVAWGEDKRRGFFSFLVLVPFWFYGEHQAVQEFKVRRGISVTLEGKGRDKARSCKGGKVRDMIGLFRIQRRGGGETRKRKGKGSKRKENNTSGKRRDAERSCLMDQKILEYLLDIAIMFIFLPGKKRGPKQFPRGDELQMGPTATKQSNRKVGINWDRLG